MRAVPSPEIRIDGIGVCAPEYGMSLRDYMAAAAMQGILSSPSNLMIKNEKKDLTEQNLAWMAYAMADAMLAARGQS